MARAYCRWQRTAGRPRAAVRCLQAEQGCQLPAGAYPFVQKKDTSRAGIRARSNS